MTRIGIVGDPESVESLAASVDAVPVTGDAREVLDANPTAVVAVGEAALLDLVRAEASVPVLPVDAGRGVRSVPSDRGPAAIEALIEGEYAERERAILGVSVDGTRVARSLLDVMAVTSKPARISEFGVFAGDDRVSTVRADGVVLATPAGSHGYARDAGGGLLAPGTGVVTVVPVAPFVIDPDTWTLPTDGVGISVERDENPVSLLADDREVATLPAGERVVVRTVDTLSVAVASVSQPFFGE